jgi:hypothetical protein
LVWQKEATLVNEHLKNDQLQGQIQPRTAFRMIIRAIILFVIVFVMLLVATLGAIWGNTDDLGASLAAFTGDKGVSNFVTLALIATGVVVVISLGISRPRSPFRRRG